MTVVVITPRQAKNLRSRYGSVGNEEDRFDAYVLADVLRAPTGRDFGLTTLHNDGRRRVLMRTIMAGQRANAEVTDMRGTVYGSDDHRQDAVRADH